MRDIQKTAAKETKVDQARYPLSQISQEPRSLSEYLPSSRRTKPNSANLVLVILRCPLMGECFSLLQSKAIPSHFLSSYKGLKYLYQYKTLTPMQSTLYYYCFNIRLTQSFNLLHNNCLQCQPFYRSQRQLKILITLFFSL